MKVIVTGGAGFIGSKLVKHLSGSNEVVVLDNLHSGSINNLQGTKARFVHMDAKEIAKLELEPDLIFHLGMYSASAYYKDPKLMVEVLDGANQVFQLAVKHRTKVVTASTSSVYYGQRPPQNEEMVPKVVGPYTEGRVAMERLAELYARHQNLDVVVLRPFSVYGRGGEVKGKLANITTRLVLATMGRDDPVLYGDGTATRDFVNVDDVVDAFLKAAEVKGFQIFNVGTGISCSLNELKAKIEENTGIGIQVPYAPAPITFPNDTQADTTKAERFLGFKARKTLEEGLAELVEYHRLRLPVPNPQVRGILALGY
jgi:UDP-glucose 4-epimerase